MSGTHVFVRSVELPSTFIVGAGGNSVAAIL